MSRLRIEKKGQAVRIVRHVVPVARKNLLADKVRLVVSIGGVTFAVILILVVRSLYQGYYRELGAFVDELPVDVWVTQTGSGGLLYSSTVADDLGSQLAGIDGVANVVAMDRQRVRIDVQGKTADVIAMAFDLPQAAGPALGLDLPGPGEVTIDASTAQKSGIHVGDTVQLRGKPFIVSRITSGANLGLSGLAIVSWSDSGTLLGVPGYVSSWLVALNPGANEAAVISSIDDSGQDVQAFSRQEFASANRAQISSTFLPIITVLFIVSFLVGSAVVGITIYTAVTERMREFGVMKAIGASTRVLYRMVLQQSVIVCTVGFAVGVPSTYVINRIAKSIVPEFITLMRWQDCLLAFGIVLAMALFASVVPVRSIAKIDPAEVFRA